MAEDAFRQFFHHYDVQSITTEISKLSIKNILGSRRNTTTGASAASSTSNKVELCADYGDYLHDDLVLSCPYFRNEIPTQTTSTNSKVQILEQIEEDDGLLDNSNKGALYYRRFFYQRDHENYFALDDTLGPIAISIIKEKSPPNYFYRVIFRTSELTTIRGCIAEDVVTKSSKNDKIYAKELVELVFPMIQSSGLRLANTNTAPNILLKLDEQGTTTNHKIGILYCRNNQTTEEEFYNNEHGSEEFDQFLDFLGDRVRLKGFQSYSGGLDTKDDTTGLTSVFKQFTNANNTYQIMFHVSTLLPFTPANRQQLMRKRHIGNDIVTIIFQEANSLPFTPKSIRSQFQHVFIIVRIVNNCYSISVSRSMDVPMFGPDILYKFYKRDGNFLEFLLSKIINAELASYKSEKFTAMAIRTRNEYLKDLYLNHWREGGRTRFSILKLPTKKKLQPPNESTIPGALSFKLATGYLAISQHYVVVTDTKQTIKINDLLAYTLDNDLITLHTKHTQLSIQSPQVSKILQKIKQIKQLPQTELYKITRKYNLGFHIQNDGLITDVDINSPAGVVGLKCYSIVVKINTHPLNTLTNDEMILLLKSTPSVSLLVIPPATTPTPTPTPTQTQTQTPITNNMSNHLNSQAEGILTQSPQKDYYYSSSGYGTGSSSKSFCTPPPLPARRRSVSKSSDNLQQLQQRNRHSSIYYDYCGGDVSKDELNTRVAYLKSAYLSPKKTPTKPLTSTTSFQKDLLKLILDDDQHQQPQLSIYQPTINSPYQQLPLVPLTTLETRVALLEEQLLKEQATKEELRETVDKLKLENRKLLMDYESNSRDVRKLKALLRI